MTTYTATEHAPAPPAAVLEVLTDPEAARRWAPVAFRLRGGEDRLVRGNRVRVVSHFAGQPVGFDVHVIDQAARTMLRAGVLDRTVQKIALAAAA